ncbi:MAG: hypothetical protein ACYDG2_10330, partial [Ruminiclostridium sp.]
GRRIADSNYFSTVGEFLDIIPLVCDEKEYGLEQIENIFDVANKYSINFLSLLNEPGLKKKYKKVNRLLEKASEAGANVADIPIFNYLGMYDADYHIAELYTFEEQEKTDEQIRWQRGTNCYLRDDVLCIFIDVLKTE